MNTTAHLDSGHREMAAGILQQAKRDLRRFRHTTSRDGRELYLDAYSWLMADEYSWPFSFLNVCQTLNLAPQKVRDELKSDFAAGRFAYWKRRCGRVGRKLRLGMGWLFTTVRNDMTEKRWLATRPLPLLQYESVDQSPCLPDWPRSLLESDAGNSRLSTGLTKHKADYDHAWRL